MTESYSDFGEFRRADLSHGLVHLTRKRREQVASDTESSSHPWEPDESAMQTTVPAFEVLKEILTSGVIKGSGPTGFVRGSTRAACFSEMPLSAVSRVAKSEGSKYEPYGIIVHKSSVFAAGGRPVIYLPRDEANWLPEDQLWRHVRFEPPDVDWTHEREWRCPGGFDLTTSNVFVLVWTAREALEIATIQVKTTVLGTLPLRDINKFL